LRSGIMTRAQLVNKLSLRMDVSRKEADIYLTAFLDSIMETLRKDGRVVVQGFGSFKVNEYKARVAKKPLTGELIQLPVRHKPSFHAGKELRERVNEEMELVNEAEEILNRISVPENIFSISAG
jgi:nucleoid DNA-binding protein